MFNNKVKELKSRVISIDHNVKNELKNLKEENNHLEERIKTLETCINDLKKLYLNEYNKTYCSCCGNEIKTIFPQSTEWNYFKRRACYMTYKYAGMYGYCEKCKKEVKICEKGEED